MRKKDNRQESFRLGTKATQIKRTLRQSSVVDELSCVCARLGMRFSLAQSYVGLALQRERKSVTKSLCAAVNACLAVIKASLRSRCIAQKMWRPSNLQQQANIACRRQLRSVSGMYIQYSVYFATNEADLVPRWRSQRAAGDAEMPK